MAAPKGNKNAEKWTLKEATKFLKEAVSISKKSEYDFIGEVAFEHNTTRHVYNHIVEKFPELQTYFETIKSNCERNCFTNGKKGDIVPSMAIMNLKSNHGWTDRSTIDANVKTDTPIFNLDD